MILDYLVNCVNYLDDLLYKFKFKSIPIPLCVLLFVFILDTFCIYYDLISLSGSIQCLVDNYIIYILNIYIFVDLLKGSIFDKKKILFVILILFARYNVSLTNNFSLYYVILFSFVLRRCDIKDVFFYLSIIISCFICFGIIYYFINCTFLNYIPTLDYRDNHNNPIYNFGYAHKNLLGMFVVNITILFLYSTTKKLSTFITLFVINCLLFYFCYSRTAFIMSLIALLMFFIDTNFVNKIYKTVSSYIFPLCTVLYAFITFLYIKQNRLGLLIDKLLTNRVLLTKSALEAYGITFLGNKIEALSYITIDSLYPHFAFRYGLIWVFILSILFYLVAKKGNRGDWIMIILFSIYALSEHTIVNLSLFSGILILKKIFSTN